MIDAKKCDSALLDNLDGLEKLLKEAVDACDVIVLGGDKRRATPNRRRKDYQGPALSVLLNLGEGHASLLSFPEAGIWRVDLCLPSRYKSNKAFAILRKRLGGLVNTTQLERS